MKRLAVLLLVLPMAANADIIKIGFYQGGYDEGAFVAGYLVANEIQGTITHDGEDYSCSVDPARGVCNVLDYFMFFSGNSLVSTFTHVGLGVLDKLPGGNLDNWLGMSIDLKEGFFIPEGRIASQNWVDNFPFFDLGIRWAAHNQDGWCAYAQSEPKNHAEATCGMISDYRSGARTRTRERVRLFKLPEPGTLALLGIGLAGMGLARRRKVSD